MTKRLREGDAVMVPLYFPGHDMLVSKGSKLAFYTPKPGDVRVEFIIEGISFITTETILNANPTNFLAGLHRSSVKMIGDAYLLEGKPFESAHMFPIIFDYMTRFYEDDEARLRVNDIRSRAAMDELDRLEDYIFPNAISSFVQDPKNPRRALIAMPNFDDADQMRFDPTMAINVKFIQCVVDLKANPTKELSDADKADFEERFSCKLTTETVRRCNLEPVMRGERIKAVLNWSRYDHRILTFDYADKNTEGEESGWVVF